MYMPYIHYIYLEVYTYYLSPNVYEFKDRQPENLSSDQVDYK